MLTELGRPPRFADFRDPQADEDQVVIAVAAAGVNHVDLAKASGSFYTGPPPLPSVVGPDGVGHTPEGRRVYFDACVPPFGAWAERTLVRRADLLEPDDVLDDHTAAARGNAGLAAWLGLSWRARLQPGESVLVLGANGALGSIAVQAAKVLGALWGAPRWRRCRRTRTEHGTCSSASSPGSPWSYPRRRCGRQRSTSAGWPSSTPRWRYGAGPTGANVPAPTSARDAGLVGLIAGRMALAVRLLPRGGCREVRGSHRERPRGRRPGTPPTGRLPFPRRTEPKAAEDVGADEDLVSTG